LYFYLDYYCFFRLDKKNALVRKPAHSNILLSTIYREIHIAKLFLVRDTKVEQNNEIDKKNAGELYQISSVKFQYNGQSEATLKLGRTRNFQVFTKFSASMCLA